MSGGGVRIGILAVQGDVAENADAISKALKSPRGFDDDSIVLVKNPGQVNNLDGLVMPGGESTTIGGLSGANGTLEAIRSRITRDRMPVMGICAGLIMLAKSVDAGVANTKASGPPPLGALGIRIRRNAFGRQRQSFEAKLSLKPLAISDFKGVFIRAPVVYDVEPGVDVLCELAAASGDDTPDKKRRIVAVGRDNIIGTAFHPELSGDLAIHKHFVDMVRRHKRD